MYIEIEIPGKPIAKARPRFFTKKTKQGKSFAGAYSAQTTEEGKFIILAREQLPNGFKPYERDVGLYMSCNFNMPIPKSTSKKKAALMESGHIQHTKKPDLDNLVKFVKDCLNGVVWHDDSQIYGITAWKQYSHYPSTKIVVNEA